ncbi:MAG: hypothetical protein ACOZQL_07860 [Myxococcota bacterium]
MARGNNGNALQHFVELTAADLLLREAAQLRLLCTHSMAPAEALVVPERESRDGKNRWLTELLAGEGTTLLHDALRGVGASRSDYPNSARLLSWFASTRGRSLRAKLCEFEPATYAALEARWGRDPAFCLVHGSWREAEPLLPGDGAWLWTMDPYTFVPGARCGGGDVCDGDLELVARWLREWTGPGAWLLFCYSMDRARAAAFRAAVTSLGAACGFEAGFAGAQRDEQTAHFCGLLSRSPGLVSEIVAQTQRAAGEVWRGTDWIDA